MGQGWEGLRNKKLTCPLEQRTQKQIRHSKYILAPLPSTKQVMWNILSSCHASFMSMAGTEKCVEACRGKNCIHSTCPYKQYQWPYYRNSNGKQKKLTDAHGWTTTTTTKTIEKAYHLWLNTFWFNNNNADQTQGDLITFIRHFIAKLMTICIAYSVQ